MKKPTIRDVAIEAGVSLGTASRVVNGHVAVNPHMRKLVETAVEKLGYRPDAVAQSMRLGTTRTVGILIRDFSSPAFVNFANVAQTKLFNAGYVTLLAGYDDRPEREVEILHAFAQRRIDGLIITTSDDSNTRVARARGHMEIPTILFDRDSDRDKDIIAIDHAEGIRTAMHHLFEFGHRRIALITGPVGVRPGRERVKGYERASLDAGHDVDPSLVRAGSFSADYGHQQTLSLFRSRRRPTAVIVGGVNLLSGVLRAIRTTGLRVPDDVSLIGSTNPELCELVTPTVTELRVDYPAIGEQASALMIGRLQGSIDGPPRILGFGTELLQRQSCGPAANRPRSVRVRG